MIYDEFFEDRKGQFTPITFETVKKGIALFNSLNQKAFEDEINEVFQEFEVKHINSDDVLNRFNTHIRQLSKSIGIEFVEDTPTHHMVDRLYYCMFIRNDASFEEGDSSEEWLAKLLAVEFSSTEIRELTYLEECDKFQYVVSSLAELITTYDIENTDDFTRVFTLFNGSIGTRKIPKQFEGVSTLKDIDLRQQLNNLNFEILDNDDIAVSVLLLSLLDEEYRYDTMGMRLELFDLIYNLPIGRDLAIKEIYIELVTKYHNLSKL